MQDGSWEELDMTLLSLLIHESVIFIVTARKSTNVMGKIADFLLDFITLKVATSIKFCVLFLILLKWQHW
jgi:hypothetical protein